MIVGPRGPQVATVELVGVSALGEMLLGDILQPTGETVAQRLEVPRAGDLIAVHLSINEASCQVEVVDLTGAAPTLVLEVPAAAAPGMRRVAVDVDSVAIAAGPVEVRIAALEADVQIGLTATGAHLGVDATPAAGELRVLLLLDAETIRRAPDLIACERALARAERDLESPPTPTAALAACGWHGARLDDRRPAVALAGEDGPLAPMVGGRVRLTSLADPTRSVVVLIVDLGDVVEDVSLSRRAFLKLAPLWTEELDVRAELLS